MGFMSLLDKVFEKVTEYTPQMEEFVQKAQEKSMKDAEKKREQIEGYQREYVHLSGKELVDEYNKQDSSTRKLALKMLVEERCEKYTGECKCRITASLVDELNWQKSPIKKKAIIKILKERGFAKDSDNVWSKQQ